MFPKGESAGPAAVIQFPGGTGRGARERMLGAMLETSGERGYEGVAVRHVIERAGASRATFYRYFDDREDCFAQAYEGASEWLSRRMLATARRQPGWREGLRAALAELLEFCANRPATAKALVVEVHAAGPRPMAQRRAVLERFARALDDGRAEGGSGRPPRIAADFVVGAIDTLLAAKLMDGEAATAPEMLPGLLHFVVMQYLGEAAAWEEMAAAPLATWKARREAAAQRP